MPDPGPSQPRTSAVTAAEVLEAIQDGDVASIKDKVGIRGWENILVVLRASLQQIEDKGMMDQLLKGDLDTNSEC